MEFSKSSASSVDEVLVAPDVYDFIVVGGGALIHSFPSTSVQGLTFDFFQTWFSAQDFDTT